MNKQFLFIFFMVTYGFVVNAQNDLQLDLDSISNAGIEQGIPGIQIFISDGQKTYNYLYGFQDKNQTIPVNDSTNWRYGSITKVFTAVIILQLESEGKLSIDDSVIKYLKVDKLENDQLTIKHLLNHTSGLYNYAADRRLQWEDSMIQCVEYSLDHKPHFEPGAEYKYCNTGFVMLGLIIEKVTGVSMQQNFQERIFDHCGLESMVYSTDEKTPKNTAKGYKRKRKKYLDMTNIHQGYKRKRKKYLDMTNIHQGWANSAGAILGSLSDLQKFNDCLFKGSLLDSVQLNKMVSPTFIYRDLDADGLEWFYHAVGLSWDLNLDSDENTIYISHGGNAQGYNCNIHYNTQSDLTIVIGMNLFPNGKYKPVFSTQNQIIDAVHKYYKAKNE